MTDVNITPEPITPKEGDGGGAVDPKSLSKVLGEALGKEFSNDETAIKAVKDTFSHVSEAGDVNKALEAIMTAKSITKEQAIALVKTSAEPVTLKETPKPEVDPLKFVPRAEFDKEKFYNGNPNLKEYQDIIETFVKANPEKSRTEVLEIPECKSTLEKLQTHDSTSKQKSVLHSNPRIGGSADKMTKAKEAVEAGNQKEAEKNAVDAVIEGVGM